MERKYPEKDAKSVIWKRKCQKKRRKNKGNDKGKRNK